MAASSRESARDALATLFSDNLTGAGQPIQAVYNHEPGDFQGQSPVTTVTGGGVMREEGDYGDEWQNTFYLVVTNFVLYADPSAGWTEADAEDALDDVEQAQANLLRSNRSHPGGAWQWLAYDGRSQIVKVRQIGGETYLAEIIPLKVIKDD